MQSRLEESLRLRDSIAAKWNIHSPTSSTTTEDIMFLHILDCIGALSCIRKDQKSENSSDNNRSSSINSEEGQKSPVSIVSFGKRFEK